MFGWDSILKLGRWENIKTEDSDETNSLGKMSSECGRKWQKSEKFSSLTVRLKEWRNVHCDGVKLRADSYLKYKRKTQEANEGF